jgi:phosphoribosylformylglycinamidine cyclo-ligase
VRSCRAALAAGGLKALAHITGGGLIENIPRVLPEGCAAELDARSWSLPPVFRWLAETARIPRQELARTFNCGIGMVAVVDPAAAERVSAALTREGERVHPIGRIVKRTGDAPGSEVRHWDAWPG